MSTGVNGSFLAITIRTWSKVAFLGLDMAQLVSTEERKVLDWAIGNIESVTSPMASCHE